MDGKDGHQYMTEKKTKKNLWNKSGENIRIEEKTAVGNI